MPPHSTCHWARALLACALCFAACARPLSAGAAPGDLRKAAAGAPDKGGRIDSEEEASSARQRLDYLAFLDPERQWGPLRDALLGFYTAQAEEELGREHPEDAYDQFVAALGLFEARDLADGRRPRAPALLRVAQKLDAAFRRRGAHPEVMTALLVQRTLAPDDEGARSRYRELAAWLSGTLGRPQVSSRESPRDLLALLQEPSSVLVRDLEQTVKLWPAPLVVKELANLYRTEGQSRDLFKGVREVPGQAQAAGISRRGPQGSTAFKLARLYLRVDRGAELAPQLRQLGRLSAQEEKLVSILETALRPGAPPIEEVRLAMTMAQNPEDLDIGLSVCRDVVRRTVAQRDFPQPFLCVGELAVQLERRGLAIRAFELARDKAPGERPIWEKLGRLYLERLRDLVGDERTGELEGALAEFERYQGRMRKLFPDMPVNISMSAALAEVGRGYYNAGRIADAVRFLERANAAEPSSVALELLGTIYLKRGQSREAVSTLERARAVEAASRQSEPLVKLYFKARIGRLIADALDLSREAATAADVRRQSVREWDQILELDNLAPERRAEVEMERGKLFYRLGERQHALTAFRQAIDQVPEEGGKDLGQIYADTISFLVQQGELEEALDAYHRALGRARLVEYLKVYCSLWVNDLARRAGQPEDPLASSFLKSVKGGKWYAELARWATGQQPAEALYARADTVGKRAEADFYLGMKQITAGNRQQGEELLHKVVASDMMAFFEYEMAATYLRSGAPRGPVLKRGGDARDKEKARKRPSGSI